MVFWVDFKFFLYVKFEGKDGEFIDLFVIIFNFLRILILFLEYIGIEIVRKLYYYYSYCELKLDWECFILIVRILVEMFWILIFFRCNFLLFWNIFSFNKLYVKIEVKDFELIDLFVIFFNFLKNLLCLF